jgi:TIR domain
MLDVFISYSTQNENLCKQIRGAFEESGISAWIHTTMIAGDPLSNQLREAINSCRVCVFLATKEAIASGWCLAEIGAFWGAGKEVVVFNEDANFDETSLPPQFRGDLRASSRKKLIDDVQKHLPPKLPRPGRGPAVLVSLSSHARDAEKCEAIRSTLPKDGTTNGPHCQEITDWRGLTSDQLSDWQGLMLAFPHEKLLTPELIADLVSWVRAGGRLVVTGFELGERHHGTNINQLTWHFGVIFNSDVIVNISHTGNPYDKQYDGLLRFSPATDTEHPLLRGVNEIAMRNVCTLHLEPGGKPLVPATPNQVLDLDDSAAVYSDRGDGKIVLAVGGQKFRPPVIVPDRAIIAEAPRGLTGIGRVVALGTWDFRTDKSTNQNGSFLVNLWSWLAGND